MTTRTDPQAMTAEPIRSARLDLSPLRPTDADEMVEVLADPLQPVGTVQATVTADDPAPPERRSPC